MSHSSASFMALSWPSVVLTADCRARVLCLMDVLHQAAPGTRYWVPCALSVQRSFISKPGSCRSINVPDSFLFLDDEGFISLWSISGGQCPRGQGTSNPHDGFDPGRMPSSTAAPSPPRECLVGAGPEAGPAGPWSDVALCSVSLGGGARCVAPLEALHGPTSWWPVWCLSTSCPEVTLPCNQSPSVITGCSR